MCDRVAQMDRMVGEANVVASIVSCRSGCVVAPAGCGKTEHIAHVVATSEGTHLILTHTLAGVDALRSRFKKLGVESGRYEINTIAAWALRLVSAFPVRSGMCGQVAPGTNWKAVYAAAARLLRSGAIASILRNSYAGALVDEYQDCTREQHELVCALRDLIPCCVFGDPLQAIFEFGANVAPAWEEVLVEFPKIAELTEPWRWKAIGNERLGRWLLECREALAADKPIALPNEESIRHIRLTSGDAKERYRAVVRHVLKQLHRVKGQPCVVIGDARREGSRAKLARDVRASSVEPVNSRTLQKLCIELEQRDGLARLEVVTKFATAIMTKVDGPGLKKKVGSAVTGKARINRFSGLELAALQIAKTRDLEPILEFLGMLPKERGSWVYRRELYSSFSAALRQMIGGKTETLSEAVFDVQNRRRHAGRKFPDRVVGSTLLIKGLEFDHVILLDIEDMDKNDLYVALTRGRRSVTVISGSPILKPIARA